MSDIEKDLRTAAYNISAAIPYLERVGRTLTADALRDELESIELAIQRIATPQKEPQQ